MCQHKQFKPSKQTRGGVGGEAGGGVRKRNRTESGTQGASWGLEPASCHEEAVQPGSSHAPSGPWVSHPDSRGIGSE